MLIASAAEDQTLKFIGRSLGVSGSISITDEQKNTTSSMLVISYGNDRYYTTVNVNLSSYDNERKYKFVAASGGNEIYRGILFLTSQDPDSYSINNGLYNEPTADNEYLVA